MAESFYTSGSPTSPVPHNPQSPVSPSGPPPPPPPKPSSHEPSRTSTPHNQPTSAQYQGQQHIYSQSGPQPPPVPPSPSHVQALAKQQSARYNNPTNSAYSATSRQDDPNQPQHRPQYQPQQQVPTIRPPPLDSGWLPEGLSSKSTAELQPLLNDPALLTAFAHLHPSYKSSGEPLQAAISANLALAQQVAALEAQVKQLRDQTGQLLINHTSLQTQWRRKQTEMDDALSPWGPRAMYQRLVSSIAEQEALLRAVHDSFIEGGGDDDGYYGSNNNKATEKEVTEWVKRVREGTTILEKRREMRSRWDEGRVGGWR